MSRSARDTDPSGVHPVHDPDVASIERVQVKAIMSSDVLVVFGHEDTRAVMAQLTRRGAAFAVVVDAEGGTIGTIDKLDLAMHHLETERRAALGQAVPAWVRVERVMTPVSYLLPAGASVARAAAYLAFGELDRLLVVDSLGRLLGVVTPVEVLGWMARRCGFVVPPRARATAQ